MKNFWIHFKTLGKISMPLTLGTLSSVLMVLIDSYFALTISASSYKAVFLTLPIVSLVSAIAAGITGAMGNLLVQAKTNSEFKLHFISSICFACFCSLLLFYFCFYSQETIDSLCGFSKENNLSLEYRDFRIFWSLILYTFPIQIFFALTIQLLTIYKKEKIGSLIIVSSCLLNIILNYYFTIELNWGIYGLGLATLSISISSFLITALYCISFDFYKAKISGSFLRSLKLVVYNSLMIFIAIGVFSIGSIIFNQLALSLSVDTLLIYAISNQVRQFFSLSVRGLTGGFIIYLSDILKRKNFTDYFTIYWAGTLWIAIIYCIGSVIIIGFSDIIVNKLEHVDQKLIPSIDYFLLIGTGILIAQILPRMAQVGFMSLNKSFILAIQSFFMVISESLLALYLIKYYSINGLILGQLWGNIFTTLLFVPIFWFLLKKQYSIDKKAHMLSAIKI